MKTAADIRKQFLDYFSSKGHTIVESSAVVPQNDPTLLFTNAGMVQFKDVFLGAEKRPYSRATSSQKCIRAGGKHNDLENVGHTARHHTFFEMLGNFSFGDYFKEDAIAMGWEFLTRVLNIPVAGLWVTVFDDDDEAYEIWKRTEGVPADRIVRMGEKDNFWSMGDTGPCGPCSEILIDQGESFSCGKPDCKVGCDCDRYLELWNLVFMQFDRDEKGVMTPLPKPSIDTGMGLERVTAVLQHVKSNYDTDLFAPLIECVEKISGIRYGTDQDHDASMRVIGDHTRATAFLIADGVLPSNEGRGYVLRRIMRRAARRGRLLGIEKPFLCETVVVLANQMQEVYPELKRSLEYIQKVVLNEEQSFSTTLAAGLKILEDEMVELKTQGRKQIPGDVAFRLYDTYGFPMDLTNDIARDQGLAVDEDGFQEAMLKQKDRARQAWKGSGDEKVAGVYKAIEQEGMKVAFKGYDTHELKAVIEKIITGGEQAEAASQGDEVEIIALQTPFYGESGGQAGDTGTISGEGFRIDVTSAVKLFDDLIVHRGKVSEGAVKAGDEAVFAVDADGRRPTACNHTATHILQSVLRECLGNHVKQAGSLVAPERLRFDFTHFEAIGRDTLRSIENRVNERIRENSPVRVKVVPRREAIDKGATALFGEKYGEEVRVVRIDEYSMELCGGTHTRSTGELGTFKIVSEGAVAAGVRRIEAVTGEAACRYVQQEEDLLDQLAAQLKTDPAGLSGKIERMMAAQKTMEKEIEKLNSQLLSGQATSILDQVEEIGGVKVLAARIDGKDPKAMRTYGDQSRDRIGSGIIVFGAEHGGKAHLLAMVTQDLADRFSAGSIIKEIAPVVGGRGGGRNDMAQAGGKDAAKIDDALAKAREIIAGRGA